MANLLLKALAAFGWNLPFALAGVLVDLIRGVVFVVGEVDKIGEADGPDKLAAAVAIGREFADSYLDGVPVWGDLSEARRDRLIAGLAEWVLLTREFSAAADDPDRSSYDTSTARRIRREVVDDLQLTGAAPWAKRAAKRAARDEKRDEKAKAKASAATARKAKATARKAKATK